MQTAYPVYKGTPIKGLDGPLDMFRGWLSDELARIQRALRPAAFRTITGAYTPTPSDDFIDCDTSTAGFTVTLPDATRVAFMEFTLKNTSTNTVTISGTVDGTTNPTIATQWHARTLYSNGTAWRFRSTYP